MAKITLKGNPFNTNGDLPKVGDTISSFTLTNSDLQDITRDEYSGKKIILNCFPSIDTPVCANSVKTFNEKAAGRSDVAVLCISQDLPFAQKRFCGAEGIENVYSLSAFRSDNFAKNLGLEITDGPLKGLMARAVIVIDSNNKVIYSELVPEIAQEPNYDAVLASI